MVSPSHVRRLCVAFALLSILVTTAFIVSAASTNSSLEWPYSVLLANLTTEADKCTKVSGFRFRHNTRPNVQQLALMCADPDCVSVTNELFTLEGRNVTTFSAAFSAFTVPVVDYCWYFREPGMPCPADKWIDFLSHVKDQDANCARGTGFSFVDPRIGKWRTPSKGSCPPDCWPLGQRLRFLFTYMPCSMDNQHSSVLPMALIGLLNCVTDTQGKHPYRLFEFSYTPGWPLPPTPTTPPAVAPIPSPTSSSSSGSTDTDRIPEIEFTDEEESKVSNSGATNLPKIRRSEPRTTPQPSATASPESREEDQTEDSPWSFVPLSSKNPQGAATVSPSLSNPPLITKLPVATLAPYTTVSKTPSGEHLLPVLGVVTLGVVVLVMIVVFTKRRNKGKKTTDGDSDFTTLDTPSSATNTGITGTDSSPRVALAMIAKAIPVKHIQDIRMIGTGGYGVVFLVRDTLNDRLLASKRLVDASQASNDKIDGFIREIQLVSTLNHPCIVTFIGATWTNRTDVQALFEYMDGGDLRTYLDNTPVPAPHAWTIEKLSFAIDIADALDYIHSARDRNTPLVHRDLKSRNVLLSKSPRRAKLSDFGVSRELSNNMSMTDGVGTSRWLAPEVILGGGDYGTACDVYSFGVVLSELDTHKLPFWDCGGGGGGGGASDGMDSVLPEIAILRMVAMEGVQPSFSGSCPLKLLELARQCLSHNPAERPTAAVIVSTLKGLR